MGGFVTDFGNTGGRGGHVVLMTGYISNARLAQRLPNAFAGAGGGYFILKNFWDCGAGDAGYCYVPVDHVTTYFSDLSRLNTPPACSAKWNTEVVQAPTPPAPKVVVKITAPVLPYSVKTYVSGAVVNFAGSVTLDGASASCAGLAWKAVSNAHTYIATGCAPKLGMAIGSYTVTAT